MKNGSVTHDDSNQPQKGTICRSSSRISSGKKIIAKNDTVFAGKMLKSTLSNAKNYLAIHSRRNMYCQNCGKPNAQQASFCQSCGKPLQPQAAPAVSGSKYACPKCGKDDRVQKVSSIYKDGVLETNYEIPVNSYGTTTSTVNRTAVSSTVLASRIAPPTIQISGREASLIIALVLIIILAGCAIGYSGTDSMGGILKGLVGMIAGGVVGTIVIMVAMINLRNSKKPQWEQRLAVWNSLYYCARDDVVFKPGTDASVPSDRINDLVYRV
jgi:predicted RNA-binding Zn-ribbon protein involved in translation (DUF1610 family)